MEKLNEEKLAKLLKTIARIQKRVVMRIAVDLCSMQENGTTSIDADDLMEKIVEAVGKSCGRVTALFLKTHGYTEEELEEAVDICNED